MYRHIATYSILTDRLTYSSGINPNFETRLWCMAASSNLLLNAFHSANILSLSHVSRYLPETSIRYLCALEPSSKLQSFILRLFSSSTSASVMLELAALPISFLAVVLRTLLFWMLTIFL